MSRTQKSGQNALDGQTARTRLVVLLLVLGLGRSLLLWCCCWCALLFCLDGLRNWSSDNLLSVVGVRTRETIM
jgi:hypothetical protein